MKAVSKSRSIACKYFSDIRNNKAKCNYCGKIISYKGGGPFNLIRHIKSKNPSEIGAVRRKYDVEGISLNSCSSKVTPGPDFEIINLENSSANMIHRQSVSASLKETADSNDLEETSYCDSEVNDKDWLNGPTMAQEESSYRIQNLTTLRILTEKAHLKLLQCQDRKEQDLIRQNKEQHNVKIKILKRELEKLERTVVINL